MTNEYESNFFNDPSFRKEHSQGTLKDFELMQATFDDNHDDTLFHKTKVNICNSQNQVSTPPTSPFLYASYEPFSLSCDTSFSPCSSSSSSSFSSSSSCSSLSPILTPTTTISPSHSTLNSVSASPIKSKFHEDDNSENDNVPKIEQESLFDRCEDSDDLHNASQIYSFMSYEQNNDIDDQTLVETSHINSVNNIIIEQSQQLQQYYNKEQLRILSLIENQQQQYLKYKEFNDEQYKIDPEFQNSNSNLFKWTFIKPKFPLLFDQMYDMANGCFFLAGIPVEFIFDLYKCNQDLISEDEEINVNID